MAIKDASTTTTGNQAQPSQVNTIAGAPKPQVLPGGQVIAPNSKSTSVNGDVDHSQRFS